MGREWEGLSPNENPGYGLDETKLTLVQGAFYWPGKRLGLFYNGPGAGPTLLKTMPHSLRYRCAGGSNRPR